MADAALPATNAPAAPLHGGDLGYATRIYGRPAAGWLDLSTGVNPEPWPLPPGTLGETLARLPEPDALAGLIRAARAAYDVPASVPVIAAPGSDMLLRLLPLVLPAGPAAIVAPTYGGHLEAWRAARREMLQTPSLKEAEGAATIVVLCNPNNPDGRIFAAEELVALSQRLATRGGFLIVDEAFADVAPRISLAPHLAGLSGLVLRSFGKFHGLAGLRLGFALGASQPLVRLQSLLGAWPVGGAAIAVGTAALSDQSWRDGARLRLSVAASRLGAILVESGLAIVGGTDLFVLAEHPEASALHAALARAGIWTRAFPDRPTWLRFGLPPADAWSRLARALESARRR